jgi:hypothetical protein
MVRPVECKIVGLRDISATVALEQPSKLFEAQPTDGALVMVFI